MTGTKVSFDEAAKGDDDSKHDRSSIAFPYLDLDSAVDVAKAVYNRAGLGTCRVDELAAQMNQTVSGAFRLKTASAKTFGFLDKDGQSQFKLSELGQRVVSPATEIEARASAFLAVPLYEKIFEKYRGHLLPPAKALEREMAALGVAPKQTDKARQIFTRSASQAGFTAQGEDRLVQPRFDKPLTKPLEEQKPRGNGGDGGGSDDGTGKPLGYQLIDLLKRPDIGETERAAIWTLVQFLSNGEKPA